MNLKLRTYLFSTMFLLPFGCQKPVAKSKNTEPSKPLNSTEAFQYSQDVALHWEQLKCGLWKSNQNDIGFQMIEFDSMLRMLTTFSFETQTLKSVIDTATFQHVGGCYYKDKRHVYHHYVMIDGGNFNIHSNADPKTFKSLGNYAHFKDKNHVFDERHGLMEIADVKTFKTCAHCTIYAKDKNGFYVKAERIAPNEIPDSIMVHLKKL